MRHLRLETLALAVSLAACAPPNTVSRSTGATSRAMQPVGTLVAAPPADVGFDPSVTAVLDSIIAQGIRERAAPGASLAVARYGRLIALRGYGRTNWAPNAPSVDADTRYDLASLTKVIATTTAAMILEDEGRLDIGRTVRSYLPELNAPDKAGITVRMLLTHRGGLEAFAPLWKEFNGRAQYREQINRRPLKSAPGTETVYSDWDFILTQLVIERITGQTLDAFTAARVFSPLGMTKTGFNPDTMQRVDIAPTEFDSTRGGLLWGKVHDENAAAMGGVAGHAGLFSSARDLAVFAQMLMNGGSYNGVRIVKPATVARWTARQGPESSRALGWDTPAENSSAGRYFSPRSFGHTGFTGTSIWLDPERGLFVVLLTNRVNPTRANTRHVQLRRDVADAVQRAIVDAPLVNWEPRR